jgi:hypothetical protein
MINWSSPQEIAHDATVFERFMHALLGLYIWEWFTTLPFDWRFISGQKKFKWPMIFYFIGRYSLLFALIGIVAALNVETEINCPALYTFNAVAGNIAVGAASINLSIRTMAIWTRKWYIVGPLVVIILGHWSLLLHGVLVTSRWDPEAHQCVITEASNTILAATFIYSMSFDFLVMTLTAIKLFSSAGHSRLVGLIFNDGLIYFLIAFVANLIATIFMLLNLNPIMTVIGNVPAAVASTIVACRAVRRLTNFTDQPRGPEIYGTATARSRSTVLAFRQASTKYSAPPEGSVHVQMDTFESPRAGSTEASNLTKTDTYDPEAQQIADEFKRPPY